MILLKCINDAGYVYLDLKPENILYKCYKNNHFKISLGDLGSIIFKDAGLMDRINTIPMAYMPYITESGTNENNIIVWLFGLNILDIYGISTGRAPGYKILNPRFLPTRDPDFLNVEALTVPSPQYYGRVTNAVSSAVSALESYRDETIDATHYKEIEFIQNLLERIFVPITNRITFEEINTLFTQFNLLVSSKTSESPVTVEQIRKLFCSIIRTEFECTQSTPVCTWDDTQDPPCSPKP
jgi:serine/threonine protein kinase